MSRLLQNIIYNFLGQGLLLVIGFGAIKFIYKHLGEDALGIIYFTVMLNSMVSAVLQSGIASTLVREVSARFKADPSYIHHLVRTASLFFWGVYGFFALLLYLLAPLFVEKWINLSTMEFETALSVLRILGISSLLALPKSLYISFLRGVQRMGLNNVIEVTISGLQHVGTIMILLAGGSLFHVIYWFSGCYALKVFVFIMTVSHVLSWASLIPGYSSSVIKENLNFAAKMIFVTGSRTLYNYIDKLIISKLMPIAAAGYYGVAFTNVTKGSMLTNAISVATLPSFSERFGADDHTGLRRQYQKLQDVVCLSAACIFAGIVFVSFPLFSFVFDQNIATRLLGPIAILCLAEYMLATFSIPRCVVLTVGKPEILARTNFYACFVMLPATVGMIYAWGLTGAALSVLLHRLFVYVYAVPRVCRECLEIPVTAWYRHVAKFFVLSGCTYGMAWYLLNGWFVKTILHVAVAYASASCCFALGGLFLINPELKHTLSYYGRLVKTRIIRN
jgi:O-antigen/teichoic acid export membrane protein